MTIQISVANVPNQSKARQASSNKGSPKNTSNFLRTICDFIPCSERPGQGLMSGYCMEREQRFGQPSIKTCPDNGSQNAR